MSEAQRQAGTTQYYTAPPVKFALLSLCSFKAYELYWFYRNWRALKAASDAGGAVFPALYAILAPVTAYPMFLKIFKEDDNPLLSPVLCGAVMAAIYLLLYAAMFLPGSWALLGIFSFLPVMFVNGAARKMLLSRGALTERKRLGAGGWAIVLVGGTALAMRILLPLIDAEALSERMLAGTPYEGRFSIMQRFEAGR